MNYAARVWIVIVSAFVGGAGTLLFVPPIPQDPAYHLFADIRTCLGIPNFGNVVSNAAFIVVGVLGLLVFFSKPAPRQIRNAPHTLPFAVFFISIIAVGIGSAYYHWQPDNESLFWDRLPMTMAFMSITAAIIADPDDLRASITKTGTNYSGASGVHTFDAAGDVNGAGYEVCQFDGTTFSCPRIWTADGGIANK